MKERLLRILDSEQLTSSKFADVIGVQRSSVSHIISGRNKPSYDFLQKTLKAFPMVNAEWLLLGTGNMYMGEDRSATGNLFEQSSAKKVQAEKLSARTETGELSAPDSNESISADNGSDILHSGEDKNDDRKNILPESRQISRIVIFYDNNTFESFTGKDDLL